MRHLFAQLFARVGVSLSVSHGGQIMRSVVSKGLVALAMGASLLAGGCATTEEQARAQAAADAAAMRADRALAAADAAQRRADDAAAAAAAAQSAADRA